MTILEKVNAVSRWYEESSRSNPGSVLLLVLIANVALGDWLLWGHFPGLSLGLFLVALALSHLASHFRSIKAGNRLTGIGVLLLALLPLIEVMNFLTFITATGGTFAACMIFRGVWPADAIGKIDGLVSSCLLAGFRFPAFLLSPSLTGKGGGVWSQLSGWLVPLALALGFVLLFQEANPVLQNWLQSFDLQALLDIVFTGRVLFWLLLAWCAWPYLEGAAPVRKVLSSVTGLFRYGMGSKVQGPHRPQVAFFERCLILFNGVFAVQSLMDIAYLWGGVSLPDGMGYAEFAHRGAYPLVVAALLAALFVLVAMRPGGAGEISSKVRVLVLVWVGQNLMLVASSMLRLDLYVSVYALTYWRIAAFIWMGLVMAGLVLIVVRFVTGKSSEWLLSANIILLAGVLYATSLVNIPGVIMAWNLRHIDQVERTDWYYLQQLGSDAYPALVRFMDTVSDEQMETISARQRHRIESVGRQLAQGISREKRMNWRSWSFRWQRAYWAHEKNPMDAAPMKMRVPELSQQ